MKTFGKLVSKIEVNGSVENIVNANNSGIDYVTITPTTPANAKKMFDEMLATYRKYMIEHCDEYFTVDYINWVQQNTFKVVLTCLHTLGTKGYLKMVETYYKRPYYKPLFCSPIYGNAICDVYDMFIGKRDTFTNNFFN